MSLAALTATYTDSEDEDEQVTRIEEPSPENNTNDSITRPLPSRLVSYGEPDENDEDRQDSSMNLTDDMMQIENNTVEEAMETETSPQTRTDSKQNEDEDEHIKLPPEPRGECSPQLQEKISKLFQKKMNKNFDTISSIQGRKDFRNPSIYEKLISYCSIDELGTNYPSELYNPYIWENKSYYDELGKVQKSFMEKREKEKKAKIEFVSGTAKKQTAESTSDDNKKRKSKWDVGSGTSTAAPSKPEVSSFVPLASGNKATVIPAFGSFVKKK